MIEYSCPDPPPIVPCLHYSDGQYARAKDEDTVYAIVAKTDWPKDKLRGEIYSHLINDSGWRRI